MKKSLLFLITLIASLSMTMLLTGCGGQKVPKEFVGTWESQINRNQKVTLKIEKDGKYVLKIFERNNRTEYEDKVIAITDHIIKLPSDNYIVQNYGGTREWHTVGTVFYFRSDGAFSSTEAGLNNPYGYLRKVD